MNFVFLDPCSMVPQPVLMHVKLMEAQTNQTISKLLALREAENNGYPQVVAKRKLDTGQSNSNGRKKRSRDRARVMAMNNNYPQNRLVARYYIFLSLLSLSVL